MSSTAAMHSATNNSSSNSNSNITASITDAAAAAAAAAPATSTTNSNNKGAPKMTLDPRFLAARQMMQAGRADGAVDMFATLVEEAIAKHSDSSLEAAVCFYEYGNALFRNVMNSRNMEDDDDDTTATNTADATAARGEQQAAAAAAASLPLASNVKAAAASAAEARLQLAAVHQADGGDTKPAAKTTTTTTPSDPLVDNDNDDEEKKGDDKQSSNTNETVTTAATATATATVAMLDDEDIPLALEMMENAYAILEEKASLRCNKDNEWMQRQMPRVLQGLGDVLREINRMADAADAYSRALPYREEFVQVAEAASANNNNNSNNNNATASSSLSLQQLTDRRLLVEANVLVAEALLGCAHGHHVVTSETNDMLVTADERVDYARGYYDKARDELQDTVYLLGTLAAQGTVDLGNEKENVCLAATLLMGVGETLAAFDEEATNDDSNNKKDVDDAGEPPAAKKAKRT